MKYKFEGKQFDINSEGFARNYESWLDMMDLKDRGYFGVYKFEFYPTEKFLMTAEPEDL